MNFSVKNTMKFLEDNKDTLNDSDSGQVYSELALITIFFNCAADCVRSNDHKIANSLIEVHASGTLNLGGGTYSFGGNKGYLIKDSTLNYLVCVFIKDYFKRNKLGHWGYKFLKNTWLGAKSCFVEEYKGFAMHVVEDEKNQRSVIAVKEGINLKGITSGAIDWECPLNDFIEEGYQIVKDSVINEAKNTIIELNK